LKRRRSETSPKGYRARKREDGGSETEEGGSQ